MAQIIFAGGLSVLYVPDGFVQLAAGTRVVLPVHWRTFDGVDGTDHICGRLICLVEVQPKSYRHHEGGVTY